MKRFVLTLAAATLGAAALGAASAQPGPGGGPGAGPGAGAGGGRGPERMFEQLDTNRDGRISREEAWAWVVIRFQAADADRDGAVTLVEFQAMPMRWAQAAPADAPRRAEREGHRGERRAAMFRGLDQNSDGRVILEEVRPFAEARFRAMDANSDGFIVREELPRRHGHHGSGHDHRGPQGGPPASR